MSKFDTRDNHLISNGYHFSNFILYEKTYELISIFGSSKFVYNNFKSDDFLFKIIKDIEVKKVSELLISIAIIARNMIDQEPKWRNDINNPSLENKAVGTLNGYELFFRDACSKIIHAKHINFDIEDLDEIAEHEKSLFGGFLNPVVYLYGDHKGKDWEAEIRIIDFCAHSFQII